MTDVAMAGVSGACSDAWLYHRREPGQKNPQGGSDGGEVGWGSPEHSRVSMGRRAGRQSCLVSDDVIEEGTCCRRDSGFY